MDKIINQYYDENNFPSLDRLYKLLKADEVKVTKEEVKKFLNSELSEQLTKQQTFAKIKSGHIIAMGENEEWQIDIFFLPKYWKENHGYKMIFAVVDIFTRKAYCVPMKTKEIEDTTKALQYIIETYKVQPHVISSDNDSSFTGGKFQALLNKYNIIHITNVVNDHNSLGIIDRFARTTKTIFTKMFLKRKSHNWVDNLDSIIRLYNNSQHRGILFYTPNEVSSNDDIKSVIASYNAYKNNKNDTTINNIAIGDIVRVRSKGKFDKGTDTIWGDKLFTVNSITGKRISLSNNTSKLRNDLLVVPKTTIETGKNSVVQAKEQQKQRTILRRENVSSGDIIVSKRIKKKVDKLNI